jgi:hypothetical protein
MKFSRGIIDPADSPRELNHTQSPGKQQISFQELGMLSVAGSSR